MRQSLGDIASVRDGAAERRSLALKDGKPVIAFEVSRTRGASELDLRKSVELAVEELRAANPSIVIDKTIDNAAPIKENYDANKRLLIEGAILAVIVVFIFLKDWRATIVAASALPLSIIPAFIGMYYLGFTINVVTLTSMALVIGILVDDAIVEIENIERHLRMGKTPYQAAMEAADEIGLAVIATTFALVAVFLPTAFMAGVPGKFFVQFGWTAVFAILASLLVARLLTPMMAAYLMKHKPQHAADHPDTAVMRIYMGAVSWCLHNRIITIVLSVLFFVGAIILATFLPTAFVPSADRAQTLVSIELPPGSSLAQTIEAEKRVREVVQKVPNVVSTFSSVGAGVAGDAFAIGTAAEARKAAITVTLTHYSDRPLKQTAVDGEIRKALADQPGVRVSVGPQDTGVKMQIVLRSDDAQTLTQFSQDVERDLRTLEGIGNVSSTASLVRPEIIVRPDPVAAAELGVTTLDMAETVRVATAGDYDQFLPKMNLTERQIPIRIKLPTEVRADLEAIGQLTVPSLKGPVRLDSVATLSVDGGPSQVNRLNRSRNVTFDVELNGRALGELYAEALKLPSLSNLPPNVKLAELGDTAEIAKLFTSFVIAMGIGVLCIYMVLVLLFHDFFQPVTILAALPPAFGGAFIFLFVTGNSISMPTMIGLIMLMGVVTKNSILLVEYGIVAQRPVEEGGQGLSRFEAMMDACHKRARPIVMTSIAMIAGMIPVAIGWAGDPSFNSPMALVVIGGLISSTLLSLLVVPAVYSVVDQLTNRKAKRAAPNEIAPAKETTRAPHPFA
jgi:multidrug efflux pump subunit AcrB